MDDPLDAERPLLLNPHEDNFIEHLKFFESNHEKTPGYAYGSTKKGEVSIETLKLNREELVHERLKVQEHARLEIKMALTGEEPEKITRIAEECLTGKREYSTAIMCEVEAYFALFNIPSPFS